MASNSGTNYTIVTHVLTPSDRTKQGVAPASPLQKFLKGEPKALGTVQIMLGVVMLLFGIVITTFSGTILSRYSGITIWGALMYIATGTLSVAASNKLTGCLVRNSLVMNVLNTLTAGLAIIIFSLDLALMTNNNSFYDFRMFSQQKLDLLDMPSGIIGVLLLVSILQFVISISVSVFGCTAVCNSEPVANINIGGSVSVANPFPAQNNVQWMYNASTASISSPPSAPAYTPLDIKGQMCY